jgi:hypothetical protein
LLAVGFSIFSIPALAAQDRCKELSETLSASQQSSVVCHCGNELSKLEVTLPKGTHLEAVCGLISIDPNTGAGKQIDLNKFNISLDKSDSSGNLPLGHIYLKGEMVLTGEVKIEPSDAGAVWFYPNNLDFPKKTVFTAKFNVIKINNEDDYKNLHATKFLSQGGCWFAKAKIKMIGMEVNLSDTDYEGVYPSKIEVLKVTAFNSCVQKQQ